jgi:hypothetical protein
MKKSNWNERHMKYEAKLDILQGQRREYNLKNYLFHKHKNTYDI